MEFIFDWCDSPEFSENSWRSDEEIISLEIFQKEFSFATAKISLVASGRKLHHFAKIGLKTGGKIHLIFAGRLTGFPVNFHASSVQIELIAEPADFQRQLAQFSGERQDLHVLQENVAVDDLFYADADLANPTVQLEGSNDIFYWSPSTGRLSRSNIARGARKIEITDDDILQNSVKVRLAREPYTEVEIALSASWKKYQPVSLDLFPLIAQRFQNNFVNSFTDIRANFERMSCAYCEVCEINPNTMGCLTDYPTTSPSFSLENERKCSFKRFYYNGKIIFSLDFYQPVKETVRVRVRKNLTNNAENSGKTRVVRRTIELKNIQLPKRYPHWVSYAYYAENDLVLHAGFVWKCCKSHRSGESFDEQNWAKKTKIPDALVDDACDSFFETPRGRNAIKYAAQKALALLNFSQRYVEIDFAVPLEKFFDLSLDDEVVLRNVSEYQREIRGKVMKIQMIATTKKNYLRVTVGCGEYYDAALLRNWSPEVRAEKIPTCVTKTIAIENPPEYQLEQLRKLGKTSLSELKSALSRMTTKIKVAIRGEKIPVERELQPQEITVGPKLSSEIATNETGGAL